ncbi:MAG: hypothetical protein ACE361_08650 [Aureliella sp.]
MQVPLELVPTLADWCANHKLLASVPLLWQDVRLVRFPLGFRRVIQVGLQLKLLDSGLASRMGSSLQEWAARFENVPCFE